MYSNREAATASEPPNGRPPPRAPARAARRAQKPPFSCGSRPTGQDSVSRDCFAFVGKHERILRDSSLLFIWLEISDCTRLHLVHGSLLGLVGISQDINKHQQWHRCLQRHRHPACREILGACHRSRPCQRPGISVDRHSCSQSNDEGRSRGPSLGG